MDFLKLNLAGEKKIRSAYHRSPSFSEGGCLVFWGGKIVFLCCVTTRNLNLDLGSFSLKI
jgi:hypothetical protein